MDEFKTHPLPPPPGSFLSGAKGASPACRADWPARDDTKVPPSSPPSPPSPAQHGVLSDFNVGHGGKVSSRRRRRGKRAENVITTSEGLFD